MTDELETQSSELGLSTEAPEAAEASEASDAGVEQTVEEAKKGYLDYNEYVDKGNDPDTYQGHKAYDNYGKLLKEVRELRQEIKTKDTTLHTMANLYREQESKIADKYKAHYAQQHQQLAQAEEVGDTEAVRESARAMAQTEQQYQQELQQNQAQYHAQLIDQFKAKNTDWYNASNPQLQQKAQELAVEKEKLYPHLVQNDPGMILQMVEEEIRTRHLPAQQVVQETKASPQGTNYAVPPKQAVVNKGGANVNTKLNSLSAEQKAEFKDVQKFMANQGIDYAIEDFLSFQERNGE